MSETTAQAPHDPARVVEFWRAAGPARWFSKDDAFDREFRETFLASHEAAADGRLDDWSASPEGALALLILLDQFPRNAFRGSPRMYATDPIAREIADTAIDANYDTEVAPELRAFFYLPFMHSEDLADQERCVALCEEMGDANTLRHAREHRDIVQRFGRFPHRNAVLGRQSSDDEIAFLDAGGFSG